MPVEEDDKDAFPGLSLVIVPLPNGRVVLLEPFERLVVVPEPKVRVVPVTVLPLLSRSVVIVPLPNGRVVVFVPSDQLVVVPVPNLCVVPVTVFPLLSRSVVIEPLPKGLVLLLVPSERFVIVPEPNFCVVPVRDLLTELLEGSAANKPLDASTIARASDVSSLAIVLSILGNSAGTGLCDRAIQV